MLVLAHTSKKPAEHIRKLVQSAIANAVHNFGLSERGLAVKEIRVDGGPVLKRFRPRAFGRAARIMKRTSHVTVVLTSEDEPTREVRSKKSEPLVRDVSPEDVERDGAKTHEHTVESRSEKASTSVKRGFVGRMFRRKAI